MTTPVAIAIAMVVDAVFGEPDWLWSRVRHPAVLIGNLISFLEKHLNTGAKRKLRGTLAVVILLLAGVLFSWLLRLLPGAEVLEILLAAILLAQRSLASHVVDVADALRVSLEDGRKAVARIVGRDTRDMDQSGIARGAIESAAENLSDGVIAPIFWFLIAGFPGLLIYKIINTADSMIGYRNSRYAEFGWAAARLDDLINLVPARLTALLIVLAHFRLSAVSGIWRDAPLHRSPNAGWPEAAMAQCLNVALAGPRSYDGTLREFAFVNPQGEKDIGPLQINRAVFAMWRTWVLTLVLILVLAVV